MNRTDLFLSYKIRGKHEKKVKLSSLTHPFIFGNSRKANIVLKSDDISPLHTAIEYRNGNWYLLDLSSETGTWIDNDVIAETKIDKNITFRVGPFSINVEPKDTSHDLFNSEEKGAGGSDFHEVVLKNKKGLVATFLLDKKESYLYRSDAGDTKLEAPKSSAWVTSQFGKTTVIQRLVKAPQGLEKLESKNTTSKILPMTVFGVIFLLVGVIALFPKAPRDEDELKKPETNRYTQLIYDSKLVQKKREEALKIAKETFKAPVPEIKESTGVAENRKQAQTAPKIITNIKASGLQQLLGKIAQRQNINNKNVIISNGTTDYTKSRAPASLSGTKMASVSGVSGGVTGNGKGFQLSAIGTKGVGGGGNVTGYGALKGGGIGTANVGAVEEEADIGAGLDRDAVAAVIRANIGQIRYCYERKLVANPNLYGKILVQFSIEGAGLVQRQKVSRTSMQDADVEGCILRRLAGWKFPTPPVGTSVLVTYPFLFKSTQ